MPRGPVVNFTITGESREAQQAFRKVGDAAEDAAQDAGRSARDLGGAVGGLTDRADQSEAKFRGLGDTITGTSDIMANLKDGNIVGLAMGFADLAGGVADFAGPTLSGLLAKLGITTAATDTATEAQVANNAAMSANPIGLVVLALAALAAAFYLAWTKSETFRNIVTGAFDAVTGAAQATWHWVADNWPYLAAILAGPFAPVVLGLTVWRDDIARIFGEVKDRIRTIVSNVDDIILAPFKLARLAIETIAEGIPGVFSGIGHVLASLIKAPINAVIDGINAVQVHIHLNLPGPIPDLNFDWGGLGLPHLAQGGRVRARPGGVLAVLGEAGEDEYVIPASRVHGGWGATNIINMPAGTRPDDAFLALERYRRRNGIA